MLEHYRVSSQRLYIALTAICTLICIWGMALYELNRTREAVVREAEVRATVQAHVFAEYSRSAFKRLNEVIIDLRDQWRGDWRAFSALVQRTQENIDDLTFQVAIIDADGLLAFSNLAPPNDRTDLSQREHFRVHRDAGHADRLFISRPLKGKVSGKWSIQVTRPIFKNGAFAGVMVVSVSPEQFAGFARSLGIGGESVLTVVRDTGEVMARYPPMESMLGLLLTQRPFLQADAPLSGNYQQLAMLDGKERIFGYRRVPEYGMTFVQGEALTEVLVPYTAQRLKILFGASAVSFMAIVLFVMLFRSLDTLDGMRRQLSAIFELSPDGFVSFDAAGRVKYANPAFLRLFGGEESRWLNIDEREFSTRLAALCTNTLGLDSLVAAAAEAPDAQRHIIELRRDGRVVEIGRRSTASGPVSRVFYFRDITHETEVDRMKSEFLSTAAHELRTPMASIFGFAELMLARDFPDSERREFIEIIHRQSELMVTIINELLDLVRIEERRGKDFKRVRLDLRAAIGEVIVALAIPAGRCPPDVPSTAFEPWVVADRDKLAQALRNVLSNAYKYSPAGGPVTVEIVADPVARPGCLGVRVADCGIGMTPEQQRRVFERFYRADDSGKIPGTGLGMSIVREILLLLGGDVEVASRFGEGTTVTLWLPRAPEATA